MPAKRQSVCPLPEKLRNLVVSPFVVPWNEGNGARKLAPVHLGQQVPVVQVSIGALQRRVINNEFSEAMFAMPAAALENPPEKHSRRKQPGKIRTDINAAGLLLDIGNGAARQ